MVFTERGIVYDGASFLTECGMMLSTETFNTIVVNFIELFVISAPWLLLGLVLAGMIKVFVPADFMSKHLGKEGIWTTVKAAVFGAPLPLCSCGVIPAALGLRRSGASKSATTAFLVSTPETGIDSVSVSYVLLGPFMAVIRPIAAVSSGVVAGLLVGKDDVNAEPATKDKASNEPTSCCVSKKEVIEEKSSCCSAKEPPKVEKTTSCCAPKDEPKEEASSCCASDHDHSHHEHHASPATSSLISKLGKGIHYAANDLLKDTAGWLLIGLFFAALIQTFVSPDFLAQYGQGIFAMVIMIMISIPMYICATSSTPIAAGLLLSGVSPGAVLVFMLAGPATNIATLGVVKNELGNRAVIAYLIGVMGTAIAFGLLTDWLVDSYGFVAQPQIHQHHEMMPIAISYGLAAILAVLILNTGKNVLANRFAHSH